jgi:hypothetical protein
MLFCITMVMPILSGCGHVEVKDATFYYDEGISGAHVVHFLTPGTVNITQKDWDQIREGMVCMSSEDFRNFKLEFQQFCSKVNCDYQTQQIMSDFFARMDKVMVK